MEKEVYYQDEIYQSAPLGQSFRVEKMFEMKIGDIYSRIFY